MKMGSSSNPIWVKLNPCENIFSPPGTWKAMNLNSHGIVLCYNAERDDANVQYDDGDT